MFKIGTKHSQSQRRHTALPPLCKDLPDEKRIQPESPGALGERLVQAAKHTGKLAALDDGELSLMLLQPFSKLPLVKLALLLKHFTRPFSGRFSADWSILACPCNDGPGRASY